MLNIACLTYEKRAIIDFKPLELIIHYFDNIEKIPINQYECIIALETNKLLSFSDMNNLLKFQNSHIIIVSKHDYSRGEKKRLSETGIKNVINIEDFKNYGEIIVKKCCTDHKVNRINFKGISINKISREITVDKQEISLTETEFRLLKLFIVNIDEPLKKNDIYNVIWGVGENSLRSHDFRTLETHIKNLRKKITPYNKNLTTIWGFGYSLNSKTK
ncbi:winged helix-turn-helix domain-containing protein [Mycoplasma sp. P36-A1]|uniref:winged helix-turn-helix domain-containing protein n=1 Tax=Mycoplasma sp. P36-A1 TaxID=3252900 RepID=UPI003C2E7EB5